MSTPRETAVYALHQIFHPEQKASANADSAEGMAFVKMLTQSALRHGVWLEQLLNRFVSRKIPQKQALLHTILLTAATELVFMSTPDYAVINSYVDIAKQRCGKSESGFINAVLRNIIRAQITPPTTTESALLPDSFLKILRQDYSPEVIKQIAQATTNEPPLNLSVKDNPAKWAEKLGGSVVINNTIAVSEAGKIADLDGYTEGEWWVQDTAAALAAACFSDLKGKRVLDLCAAPGGKTAQLLNAGAIVTSLDCDADRLKTLEQNLQRLYLQPQQIICADVIEFLHDFNGEPFDAVLLDAPCSATGIFRRHPEVLWQKKMQDISRQSTLQQQILELISPVLKTGGELVYCTCSIAKAEGERQIRQMLKQQPNFQIARLFCPEQPQIITAEGFIRTLPFHFAAQGGCDAFFIAKLIKKAKSQ